MNLVGKERERKRTAFLPKLRYLGLRGSMKRQGAAARIAGPGSWDPGAWDPGDILVFSENQDVPFAPLLPPRMSLLPPFPCPWPVPNPFVYAQGEQRSFALE